MQDALAQSLRFNQTHRIGEEEKILPGFRDGGRGTSFDDAGKATTPYREIMLALPPEEDAVLAEAIDTARRLTKGAPEYQAIDILSDFVADTLAVNDVEENVRLLAAIDGSGNLTGQVITLGQMITARTGVCRHRSLLFKVLADHLGIGAVLVRGNYDNYISPGNPGGHAWNEVVTSNGERFLVDVMHRMTSEISDPYFASYTTVEGEHLYPKACEAAEKGYAPALADTPETHDISRLRATPWIGVTSYYGGRSAYVFADQLDASNRAALEAALSNQQIHFDDHMTTLGGVTSDDARRPVLRVRGLSRVLLERTGTKLAAYQA